jgi:hypothetical protein
MKQNTQPTFNYYLLGVVVERGQLSFYKYITPKGVKTKIDLKPSECCRLVCLF